MNNISPKLQHIQLPCRVSRDVEFFTHLSPLSFIEFVTLFSFKSHIPPNELFWTWVVFVSLFNHGYRCYFQKAEISRHWHSTVWKIPAEFSTPTVPQPTKSEKKPASTPSPHRLIELLVVPILHSQIPKQEINRECLVCPNRAMMKRSIIIMLPAVQEAFQLRTLFFERGLPRARHLYPGTPHTCFLLSSIALHFIRKAA